MTKITWIELVQEEGKKLGWDFDYEMADYILWEHTGFPSYWDGEPEASCRKQVRELLAKWGVPPSKAPTVWERLSADP